MLLQRIISTLIGVPLIIWLAHLGGGPLLIAMSVVILLGLHEYGIMISKKGYALSYVILYLSGLLVVAAYAVPAYQAEILFAVLVLHFFSVLFRCKKILEAALSLFGVLLVAWTLGHMLAIRGLFSDGFLLLMMVFLITWSTDTGAYCVGRLIGKHKLSPRISPNKTVEGALGGMALCVLTIYIYTCYFPQTDRPYILLLALVASAVGQAGDLVESAIKRWAGVKDSGHLIPGHGGIMDRFDSLMLVAPTVYYFLILF